MARSQIAKMVSQKSRTMIGLGVFLLLGYLYFVWMAYFKLETSTWQDVKLESAKGYSCDFAKYAMFPYSGTPAKSGYVVDANVWLFESHLSQMYDSAMLLDSKCVGAIGPIVKDMSFYHGKLVIQIYDARLKKVLMRIEKRPHDE